MTQVTASPAAGAARLFSDDRLAKRATQGDRRAFAAIYQRYHQDLYRYCAAILGNPEDAHDALQNTMVKVLRALPGEQRRIQLKPWLYRIAHNESVELLRRRRPSEQIDPELEAVGAGAAETAELRERLRWLITDLEELPDRQRGALVMRELADFSFEQIGVAFDTSPAVARQTVYEARLGLREMNEGREMRCEEVCLAISDDDRRVLRRRDIRSHLRSCPGCAAFRADIAGRRRDLAMLSPLPVAASTGLLHALIGGGHGGSSAGLAGTAAAGAGKAAATSAVVKSAATVAVVAAIGVTAADRGGLIHVVPSSGGESAAPSRVEPSPGAGAGAQSQLTSPAHLRRTWRHNRHPASAARAHRHGASAAAQGGGSQSQPGAEPGQSGPASLTAPTGGTHGRPHGLPNASAHGQQTAAAHKTHAKTPVKTHGHPTPPSHSSSKGSGAHHPAPPGGSTGGNGADKSTTTPFQATDKPSNSGASGNANAHTSKEAG